VSSDCIETFRTPPKPREPITQRDIRREKRLLRQAIAASSGNHRIRLQRELAALEDYERETRQRTLQFAALR
jgi:hypothetical protein